MSRRALVVLMWKHLMVRKTRFVHTFLDFLIPIFIYCLLFAFRDEIKPSAKHKYGENFKVQLPDVQLISNIDGLRRVLYYPRNNLTDQLMDVAKEKLNLKRLNFLPGNSREERKIKGYYAIPDMVGFTEYINEMSSHDAIVLFENMDGDTWPAKLSYSIRMKKMFLTNSYESSSGKSRPHRQYGEVYEDFVRLQWAIDTSYIKAVTNNDINQAISMQEFPYYGTEANDNAEFVTDLIRVFSIMSLFMPFVFLMSRVLDERCSGMQELVKMVGVSSNIIGLSHFLNVLPLGLFYAIVSATLLTTGPNALVVNTPGSLIFLIMFLHYISVVALSFVCSYFTQSSQYGTTVSVFAFVGAWMPSRLLLEVKPPRALVLLTGILPHVPHNWFWTEVASFEKYDEGLTWGEASQSHTSTTGSALLAILWFLIQIAFFFFLAWYLSRVRPGPHGIPMPWNFLCRRAYWSKCEVRPHVPPDEEEEFVKEDKYFETPPQHMDVGIRIENVSKVFPKHHALSHVSLDVYRGEITVLLGHNGAGKTTLMSIITGTMLPTEGRVLVNGLDIRGNRDHITKQIGFCPQHNLFFPELTVLEHTMFYAMLKKGTYKQAKKSCIDLLQELGLKDKAGTKSSVLSGGMKRRMQLACALAGDADVLVLDEPTAGLDVETRRSLWDLLLSLRGSRTVLLSTHFMEEADALGDRIAALHSGKMRCCATALHLKKAIGTGYRLSVTTAGAPREEAVTATVTAHIPEAALTHKTVNSLAYNLPSASSQKFPELFTSLEQKKSELGIQSIGVGVSTLEEVFLKLCSDTAISMTEEEIIGQYTEPKYNKVKGFPLYMRQFKLLLKRQIKFCLSKKTLFILLQIILPVVLISSFGVSTNTPQDDNKNLTLRLDMYKSILDPKVLYNVRSEGANVDILKQDYPKVQFRALNEDVAEGVLRMGKQDIMEYNQYLAGIELNDTDAKILYTSLVRHAAPVAMNLLTNLLAAQYMPKATGRTITAHNYPLDGAVGFGTKRITYPKDIASCITWSLCIVFVILGSLVNLSTLPCRERARSSRHIHLMAGCPSPLYWGTTLLWHFVCSSVVVSITLVLSLYADTDYTFNNSGTIGCVLVIIWLGILAFLASMYFVSFLLDERGTGIFLLLCIFLFGIVTPGMHAAFLFYEDDSQSFKKLLLKLVSFVAPPHALTVGLSKTVNVARLNAFCDLNMDKCPALLIPEDGFDSEVCCSGGLPRCYFCWDNYSPAPEMLRLAVQFFVYMLLVILMQEGILCRWYERIRNMRYSTKTETTDDMVRAEQAFVNKTIKLNDKQIEDAGVAMLVHDVHKNYNKMCKSFNAVRGINFSVKRGECFGLLGVNGAGKSTTFKMLTAEECVTGGKVYANGYRVQTDRGKYLRTLGYCPQFFGLDEFQTGHDNLKLLLTCRGLDEKDTENETKSWIGVVGLEKYGDRAVSGYSGGMSRRLGVGAALGVGGRLALLDEPTAGVDVAARRRVWAALARSAHRDRSVLLTSHSMDEMEALCDRIAIMSEGRVCALGSPPELRAHHATGHAVVLKLKHVHSTDQVDGAKSSINKLKSDFKNKFNSEIKDEHSTMLHYHINETLHYSNLFTEMESLKRAYPDLLEDYSISETTLEEVFLSFAKNSNPPRPSSPNRVV